MKTPEFIHAEYISDEAVQAVLDVYNKEQSRIIPGHSGQKGTVLHNTKESLDLGLLIDERHKLPIYLKQLHDIIDNYMRKYPILALHQEFGYVDGFNIQYYRPKQGYYKLHTERMSINEGHRFLVWMTYLTDTKNAGTHFEYLNWSSECKKGLTLIWPTDFPFTHRGVISETEDKMIITGWLGFRKKEDE